MTSNSSYTIEEVAQLLKISKLTVYDLIKKEELSAYRVGRQMRVDHADLERYKARNRTGSAAGDQPAGRELLLREPAKPAKQNKQQAIISGQDIVLDMLSKYIETHTSITPLRQYTGSLNNLWSMYNGDCDVASVHLYDGDTGEYNLPYVKRILVCQPFIMLNLVCRTAGIYVQRGNPKKIQTWRDLANPHTTIVNREKGAGARVLLDEQLRINGIAREDVNGYEHELTSHFSVASAVASGQADAGVGIENAAKMVNVDFIPMIKEQYDLVILKRKDNLELRNAIQKALQSSDYLEQLAQLNGYDLSLTGTLIYES